MAELHFCNVCDTSVPQADIDSGAATHQGERCICPDCRDLLGVGAPSGGRFSSILGSILAIIALFFALWVWWDADQARTDFRAEISTSFADQGQVFSDKLTEKLTELREELDQDSGLTATQISQIGDRLASMEEDLGQKLVDLRQETEQIGQLAMEIESLGKRLGQAEAATEVLGERQREQRGSQETLRDQIDLVATQLRDLAARGPASGDNATEAASEFAPKITSLLRQLQSDDQDKRLDALEKISSQDDPRLVPHLIPLLSDPYEFNRFYAAKTLGDWRSKMSAPHLIEALLDEISFVRQAAVQSLRQITSQNFGFEHQAEETERKNAYNSWKTWWSTNGKAFLDG
jgi:DNA repair exonuclease SbcCD ATPase subunit